jgi:hypothetical protein
MFIFDGVLVVVVDDDDDACRGVFRNGAWHVVDVGDGDVMTMCLVTSLAPHINMPPALGILRYSSSSIYFSIIWLSLFQ